MPSCGKFAMLGSGFVALKKSLPSRNPDVYCIASLIFGGRDREKKEEPMKKVLLATSALAATTGLASAQGIEVTGSAQMGILGGEWVDDNDNDTSYELHTDIDVHFTMSGQTDTGLTFGASIDLDESDGSGSSTNTPPDAEGASAAFDNRAQGGEEIFISGAFGTLTMGDTDGALDWALQEIGIGGSLGDAHTSHSGYNGNSFADGVGDGQIVRYDYSFGDFGVAVSANISDNAAHDDVFALGAKYNVSLATMELGLGVGYSQLGHLDDNEEDSALGVSLDANFNNGFRAILNWVDMGDSVSEGGETRTDSIPIGDVWAEQYMGIGLGYTLDDWTFAVNYGQYTEDEPNTDDDPGQSGYAVVVNYDLGGGAQVQFGYSKSICEMNPNPTGDPEADAVFSGAACSTDNGENSALSLGVAMSF